ncbi:MAG TPA: ferredoxin family protein [Blastocatellia bacterium]|jgi:NAD-dependent dihydropyrimidine dehydrogenase PreA subunit
MRSEEKEKIDRGRVEVQEEECKGCGLCIEACPPHVMELSEKLNGHGYHPAFYLGSGCTGCGICFFACPEPGAITVYTLDAGTRVVATKSRTTVTVAH